MHRPTTFRAALLSSWALLLGFGILMLGDGLQGTLLAVRADLEGFSATVTGLVMSSFYIGFSGRFDPDPKNHRECRSYPCFCRAGCTRIGVHISACPVYSGAGMDCLTTG